MADELPVRVTPSASRARVVYKEGLVRVYVVEPPEHGRANEAVCRLVANVLNLKSSAVEVLRGHSSREKVLRIDGISLEQALAKLTELAESKRLPGLE